MLGAQIEMTQRQMRVIQEMMSTLSKIPQLEIKFDEASAKRLKHMKEFDKKEFPKILKQIRNAVLQMVAKDTQYRIRNTLRDSDTSETYIRRKLLAASQNTKLMREKSTNAPVLRDTGALANSVKVTAYLDGRLVVSAKGDRGAVLERMERGYVVTVTAAMRQYALHKALQYERRSSSAGRGAAQGSLFDHLARWQNERAQAWYGLHLLPIGKKIYTPPRPVVIPAIRASVAEFVTQNKVLAAWSEAIGVAWMGGTTAHFRMADRSTVGAQDWGTFRMPNRSTLGGGN